MLFTSFSFIVFLSICFILYYIIPKRLQWMLLLVASYFFYAQGGIELLLFLISTTVSTYFVSIQLSRLSEQQKKYLTENKQTLDKEEKKKYKAYIKKKQWKWLLLCLFFNFGVLAVFKYLNFTIININGIIAAFGEEKQLGLFDLVLPMGISFYIFQTMGYIIDVYRGTAKAERNIARLALFVSFFPQLVQGPISRYNDLSETLYKEHSFDGEAVLAGFGRIMWGYFKKMVIADRLLPAVTTIINAPEEYQGAFVLVGMIYYAIELYADFTGGIDIVIGIGQVFGIKVAENFERPYFSKNITEYWRRWHITMGTWFKDYLFYPISICKPMRKLSKWSRSNLGDAVGRRLPVYISTLVVWFVTGLWHGASWNFIAWGVLNGVVILISGECEPLYKRFHNRFHLNEKAWYSVFQMLRTILLMSSLRLFDCYRDVGTAIAMFGTLFTKFNYGELFNGSLLQLGISAADYVVVFLGVIIMLLVSLSQRKASEQVRKRPFAVRLAIVYLMIMTVMVLGAYGIGYDSSQFIYNQF